MNRDKKAGERRRGQEANIRAKLCQGIIYARARRWRIGREARKKVGWYNEAEGYHHKITGHQENLGFQLMRGSLQWDKGKRKKGNTSLVSNFINSFFSASISTCVRPISQMPGDNFTGSQFPNFPCYQPLALSIKYGFFHKNTKKEA